MGEKDTYKVFVEGLLMSVLECGVRDLEELFEKTLILRELKKEPVLLWVLTDDIVDYVTYALHDSINYGSIACALANMIHEEIAEAVDDEELRDKIYDMEIVIDYAIISSEIIDELDPSMTREQMIEAAVRKLKSL